MGTQSTWESYTGTQGDTTQAEMGKGQNEGGFSEDQLQMYKDCFKLMDINKDDTLDKNDLRGAFDNVGVLMMRESWTAFWVRSADPAPSTTWSRCSRRRWPERETTLTTWGDKMTKAEIDDIFGEFEIDEDYMIKTKDV